MAQKRKGADPVYAVEDAATGLYLKLDGEKPEAVEFNEATTFPGTHDGRIDALKRAGTYEVVRIDA
jgi:hypothetical protein